MSCGCPPAPSSCCTPPQQCGLENFGLAFPSLVGPQGPPGGPGTFVENYSALRVIDATVFTAGYIAYVAGYAVVGDGGGGNFAYDPTSVLADNNGTILAPANNIGRWLRQYNGAINTSWFGGGQGSIAAAYAALPTPAGGGVGGGTVQLGGNISITTPVVINITKALKLDLNGFTINTVHAAGIGLSLISVFSDRLSPVHITNGTFRRGATVTANITGLYMQFSLYARISNVKFFEYYGLGSLGCLWDWVEDSQMDCVEFRGCNTGLELTTNTNQNAFDSVWFQDNVRALYVHQISQLNIFNECLFQSCTGVHAVDITGDGAGGTSLNAFYNCWFENNGDGTANARHIYISAAGGFDAAATRLINNNFNTLNGAGLAVQWFGAGEYRFNTLVANSFSGATGTVPDESTVVSDGIITTNRFVAVTSVATPAVIFPAVQVPSANVNTLDDYEEGAAAGLSFTPAYVTSNADQNVTYTAQKGTYTKIGNMVFFQLSITFNVVTSIGTGTIRITGLPFANGTDNNFGRYTVQFNDVNYDATKGPIFGYPPTNGVTYLQLLQQVDNAVWEAKTVSDTVVKAGSIIVVGGFYFV